MIYERHLPTSVLQHLIDCYWLIDSEGDDQIEKQKIVPDGYPEIILHYEDPYRINLENGWYMQGKRLLAGQIKKYFYLENTGRSGMLGVKLQPTAPTHLFQLDMSELTGKVLELPGSIEQQFESLPLGEGAEPKALFSALDDIFRRLVLERDIREKPVDRAIELIVAHKGNIDIQRLGEETGCSERQLERQFKRYVGLSPKFYTRIVRLGHIFELMQEGDQSWSDLVYHSGFYDQSHFIKNFKEFTGEDPSAYGFKEENMANFHLRR